MSVDNTVIAPSSAPEQADLTDLRDTSQNDNFAMEVVRQMLDDLRVIIPTNSRDVATKHLIDAAIELQKWRQQMLVRVYGENRASITPQTDFEALAPMVKSANFRPMPPKVRQG